MSTKCLSTDCTGSNFSYESVNFSRFTPSVPDSSAINAVSVGVPVLVQIMQAISVRNVENIDNLHWARFQRFYRAKQLLTRDLHDLNIICLSGAFLSRNFYLFVQ